MKAEFREDAFLWIVAESMEETIALSALDSAANQKGYYLPPYMGLDFGSFNISEVWAKLNPMKNEPALICTECNRIVEKHETVTDVQGEECKHIECPTEAHLVLNEFTEKVKQLEDLSEQFGISLNKKQVYQLKRQQKELLEKIESKEE